MNEKTEALPHIYLAPQPASAKAKTGKNPAHQKRAMTESI